MKHLQINFRDFPVIMIKEKEMLKVIATKGAIATGDTFNFEPNQGTQNHMIKYEIEVIENRPCIIADGGKYNCKNPHYFTLKYWKIGEM